MIDWYSSKALLVDQEKIRPFCFNDSNTNSSMVCMSILLHDTGELCGYLPATNNLRLHRHLQKWLLRTVPSAGTEELRRQDQ